MSKDLVIIEYNAETGEITSRPPTVEELSEREVIQAEAETLQVEQEAKIAARESALQKLAALGLTEEEIAAL
jgi:hypothetical protein